MARLRKELEEARKGKAELSTMLQKSRRAEEMANAALNACLEDREIDDDDDDDDVDEEEEEGDEST